MKNILMISTGGTISSSELGKGLTPTLTGERIIELIPELNDICHFDIVDLMQIDSTNMTTERIGKIALTIEKYYDDYDGFVVTHGTDTMAYTASALTYMLHQLNKPVVVTGSQKSILAKNSDAKRNVTDAFIFACEKIRGVFISFHGNIILGTRAKKTKTKSYNAFLNVSYPPIAHIEYGDLNYDRYAKSEALSLFNIDLEKPLVVRTNMDDDIFIVKLYPGMKPKFFEFIKNNYKGVVIESFGIGGIPSSEINLVDEIKYLIQEGIAVVITTQCLEEGIDLNIYEVGKALDQLDIIYSGDMNSEAVIMKLMFALGNYTSIKEIKKYIETPILGDTQIKE